MPKSGYVYIMSNWNNQVNYTGVTSDLKARAYQHRLGLVKGFTSRYNCTKLVYFEISDSMTGAIQREKQIKNFSRKTKFALVNSTNPEWRDLYPNL